MNTYSEPKEGIIVYGKHAVLAVLKHHKKLVKKAYISRHLKEEDIFYTVRNLLKSVKVELAEMTIGDLDRKAGSAEHQGLVIEISSYPFMTMEEFFSTYNADAPQLVVALDCLQDPHNVGALARTAVGMGATAMILPEHNQAPINGTVIKTSVGSIFNLNIINVVNLATALGNFKKNGFWIYGLDMTGEPIKNADFAEKTLLVIGGEGEGLRHLTKETCDLVVSLPKHDALESYNASVSGAMAMYEYQRQIEGKK